MCPEMKSIFNTAGQNGIYVSESANTINFESFPDGVYIVNITTTKTNSYLKVVKE